DLRHLPEWFLLWQSHWLVSLSLPQSRATGRARATYLRHDPLAGCYGLVLYGMGRAGVESKALGPVVVLALFVAAGITFVPLYIWVRRLTDRLLYRDMYDYVPTLRDLGARLASAQPLDQILSVVTERLRRAMNLRGAAVLLREQSGALTLLATAGTCRDPAASERLLGEAAVIGTPSDGGRWIQLEAHGEDCGMMYLGPKRAPGALRAEDIALGETVAHQAAVAAANALLIDRLREDVAEKELLRDRLMHVQEDERKCLAQIIHDDVLGVLLQLLGRVEGAADMLPPEYGAAGQLRRAAELGDYAVRQLRYACRQLYPTELSQYGLAPALTALVEEINRNETFSAVFSHPSFPATLRLSIEVEDVIYRVARQALDNVSRHARASSAAVDLALSGGYVSLSVCDDGEGFVPLPSSLALLRRGHLGLVLMRERVEALHGQCTIRSAPARGTDVCICLPAGCEPMAAIR
ncbi:MAG: histidine kinase, partial [Chloroflexota bacterium]|nr:histidine kinase [Chloroflexota bacterium]